MNAAKEPCILVARMKARNGREEDLRRTLAGLVAPTHAEAGCVRYDLHENSEVPGEFMFYEIWIDREALERHLRTPHLKKMQECAPELVEGGLQLTMLKRLNEPKAG